MSAILLLITCLTAHANERNAIQASYVLATESTPYPGQARSFRFTVGDEGNSIDLRFSREGATDFGFTGLGRNSGALLRGDKTAEIDRYLFYSRGMVLEFRDQGAQRAYLPFSFRLQPELFLPTCQDEEGVFQHEFSLLGVKYRLAGTERVGWQPPAVTKLIELNDDLFVGTSRNFRDVEGRIPQRRFAAELELDYDYRPLDKLDLTRMLASGINYFDRVLPAQLNALYDQPAFFDLNDLESFEIGIFPEIFYHPGFQGVEDFLDEPAFILLEDTGDSGSPKDLHSMAKLQEAKTRTELARTSRGRMPGLMQHLASAGINLGSITIAEPTLPIWEEHYDTACYQLPAAVAGFIQEGRYQHPEAVDLLNKTFRTSLPRSPETMFRFYFAFLRGGARVFDKDWGVSIYGQADPEYAAIGLKMAYDRGARYLWFWSSDRDHHLPFEEQLSLAAVIRDYATAHPRKDRRQLTRAATDAIVLPFGFTFSISDWQKERMANLWHRPQFSIEEGALPDGTSYYSVLRVAAEKMETLIHEGREFDIVVDVPELQTAGYERIHSVLQEAKVNDYHYPKWMHYRRHLLLVGLVGVWGAMRFVRWLQQRGLVKAPNTA